MKILAPILTCTLALSLTGCAALGALGSLLTSPLTMLSSMAKAVGRTVSQTDVPVDASSPAAIAGRGSEIARKGPFGGKGVSPATNPAESVARR